MGRSIHSYGGGIERLRRRSREQSVPSSIPHLGISVDYRKAYDMVPHSWVSGYARMVGVAQNIITLIENSMANWKTSNQEVLGTVVIKRGIFQGDSLSPLLFVITDSKGHKSWLPIQERRMQDQSPALYG